MNNFMNDTIILTDNAARRILKLVNTEGSEDYGKALRISVEGGGCSGFQYKYDFTHETAGIDDMIIKNGEAFVIIDELSASFMKGSQIDYVETLGFASFEIKNPNSVSKCGCGNSFSI